MALFGRLRTNNGWREGRYARERERMVEEQLRRRGILDERVLGAMGRVPRPLFVEEALQDQAYGDRPLPIGAGQTISQPFMVAIMVQLLGLGGSEKVLEVGAGSGYQTAVLAELSRKVYSIERIALLAVRALSLAVVRTLEGWSGNLLFDLAATGTPQRSYSYSEG